MTQSMSGVSPARASTAAHAGIPGQVLAAKTSRASSARAALPHSPFMGPCFDNEPSFQYLPTWPRHKGMDHAHYVSSSYGSASRHARCVDGVVRTVEGLHQPVLDSSLVSTFPKRTPSAGVIVWERRGRRSDDCIAHVCESSIALFAKWACTCRYVYQAVRKAVLFARQELCAIMHHVWAKHALCAQSMRSVRKSYIACAWQASCVQSSLACGVIQVLASTHTHTHTHTHTCIAASLHALEIICTHLGMHMHMHMQVLAHPALRSLALAVCAPVLTCKQLGSLKLTRVFERRSQPAWSS
eukprot:1158915-Pelagomonas_calceolata.AAC.5